MDRVGGVAGVGGGDAVFQHLSLAGDDVTAVKVALEEGGNGNNGVDGVVSEGLILDGLGIFQAMAIQSAERGGLRRLYVMWKFNSFLVLQFL